MSQTTNSSLLNTIDCWHCLGQAKRHFRFLSSARTIFSGRLEKSLFPFFLFFSIISRFFIIFAQIQHLAWILLSDIACPNVVLFFITGEGVWHRHVGNQRHSEARTIIRNIFRIAPLDNNYGRSAYVISKTFPRCST